MSERFARTRHDERACLVTSAADSTSPVRRPRRILITDAVLLTRGVAPEAKLAPAAILHFRGHGNPGTRGLRDLLRCRRSSVTEGQRRAAEQGWLTVESGHDLKKPGDKYFPTNHYTIAAVADPRSGQGLFVQLALTDELGSSAAARVLRAYYLREQRIAGAVQLPLGIAARVAGLSAAGEKKLRQRWLDSGELTRLRRGTPKRPPIFTVASTEHPPAVETFHPDKRKLESVTTARGDELTIWGTTKERAKLNSLARVDANAYRLAPLVGLGVVDAGEAFDLINTADSFEYHEARRRDREAAEATAEALAAAAHAAVRGTRFDPDSDDYDPFA